jgi:hypothetical protein
MSQDLEKRAAAIASNFKASGSGIANTAGIAPLAELVAEMAAEIAKLRSELEQLRQSGP